MIPVSDFLVAGNELQYLSDCIASGWVSSAGEYVRRFEGAWAEYCGTRHGIAVSNGTAALQIAVDALGIGPGDEIVMPSFTYISCALAVVRAGATPVVVDCDPDTYCIDVDQAAAVIGPRTRAIMPVHIYGHPAQMEAILELAAKHGLAIIEDAAEAHGSEYFLYQAGVGKWSRCGSFGTLSVFSFYGNKLVSSGEGGMILTDSDTLAERCRSLRNLCNKEHSYRHEDVGYTSRLSNLQAAVGLAQVEGISEALNRKCRLGALYDALLSDIVGIKRPARRRNTHTNHWMYGLVLEDEVGIDASTLAAGLRERGIDSRPFFLGIHQQPAFQGRRLFENLRLPVTERLHNRGICLPSSARLDDAQIEAVARAVKELVC